MKIRCFDFQQEKETRRKGINASQLLVRKFYDIPGKFMNTPYVFYFCVVFLKNQNISRTFLQNTNPFSSLWAYENLFYHMQLVDVNNVFNVRLVRIHFYLKWIVFTGKISKDTNQSTLNRKIQGTTLGY